MGKRIKSYPILRFWSCIGSAVLLCACTGRNTTQVQYQAAEHSAVVADLAQDEGKDMQEQLADSSLNSLATEQEGQLTDETVARMDASFGGDVDTLSDAERRMIEAGLVEIVPNDSTISIHLVYATPDNFMGKAVYGDLQGACSRVVTSRETRFAVYHIRCSTSYVGSTANVEFGERNL